MSSVASLLVMDRTTLTAALKPLVRRGLVMVVADPADRRGRSLKLTEDGTAVLAAAVPVWERTHAHIEQLLEDGDGDRLRRDLKALL
jgi:DNA-binding MarR family transcriptional regulator